MQNQANVNKHLTLEKLGRSVDILCSEVEGILKRNEEEALDIEFAGSFTRMIFIMVVTYCTLYGYMTLINVDKAYLNAIVPTMGYNMSTWHVYLESAIREVPVDDFQREDRNQLGCAHGSRYQRYHRQHNGRRFGCTLKRARSER